jgi:hypothetical protein
LNNPAPIFLLARTGFIIRNLLLGSFADSITKHHPLIVAVPNPEDSRLRNLIQGKPIKLISFPTEPPRNPSRFEKLRMWQTYMYRFRQAEKSTKSLEIQTRLFESTHTFMGHAANQSLIALGHALKGLRLMGFIEDRYLEAVSRWPITAQWEQILEEYKPAAVVSTMLTHSLMYTVSPDLPPVLAAHRKHIPVGTLVQSWDNLSSKTSVLPNWLDRYWSWSQNMTEELLALNKRIVSSSVKIVGSPQFDFHLKKEIIEPRETYLQKLKLDPARPYILVGTGTATWFPQEQEHTLKLTGMMREAFPKHQILIRLHPKDNLLRWAQHRQRMERQGAVFQETAPPLHMDQGGFVPPAEFYKDQINAIYHSAVVLNTASTLTVDAAIVDRPVICVAFDLAPDTKFPEGRCLAYSQSTHYGKLVRTGGVAAVHSEKEFIQVLKEYLENPAKDREKRLQLAQTVTMNPGSAGILLAQDVQQIARRNES